MALSTGVMRQFRRGCRTGYNITRHETERKLSAMIGLLLFLLLLVLLFGVLGVAVSPMFFLLVVIVILVFGWGTYSRRGR